MKTALIALLLASSLLTGSAEPVEPIETTESPAVQTVQPVADPTPEPAQPTADSPKQGQWQTESWWFVRNKTHLPPEAQQTIDILSRGGHYLGDMQHKTLYLTFDEGYENGYTAQILDILKANEVKAAFFVTTPYIREQPALVQRMVDEGHIVGNHTTTHPDCSKLSREALQKELDGCAAAFQSLTGQEMPHYFRPPEGKYSIASLNNAQSLGYETVFWSFAYADWDPDKQPGRDKALQMIRDNHHNGAILLLHAVSQSNTEALDEAIRFLKEEGYTFMTLDDLPR